MFKFYSELPGARLREMLADLSTWVWVALWTVVGMRIHDAISGFAEAGRVLRGGGDNIEAAGVQLGDALAGLPLVGAGIDDITTKTFATAGEPFQYVGGELESLLILIARLLAILVVAVFLVPWLLRYVPWRASRLATVRAAHRAIRRAPVDVPTSTLQRELATRALNRLSYPELLEHTPDPFGDFAAGRFDRLVTAELASVGLRR
jgi:hypothetical protein